MKSEHDGRMALAHIAAQFNALARFGELKPLNTYTAPPPGPQSGAEVLALMREVQARGAVVTFERIGDGY